MHRGALGLLESRLPYRVYDAETCCELAFRVVALLDVDRVERAPFVFRNDSASHPDPNPNTLSFEELGLRSVAYLGADGALHDIFDLLEVQYVLPTKSCDPFLRVSEAGGDITDVNASQLEHIDLLGRVLACPVVGMATLKPLFQSDDGSVAVLRDLSQQVDPRIFGKCTCALRDRTGGHVLILTSSKRKHDSEGENVLFEVSH